MDAAVELGSQLLDSGGDIGCVNWGSLGGSALTGAAQGAVGGALGNLAKVARAARAARAAGSRKVYRQLSVDDTENLASGRGIAPRGASRSISDHVAGKPTGHISCSMSPGACARFSSGNGLAEIDVDTAIQGGARFVDHNNVIGAVKRAGDLRGVRDAKRAQEVLFRGTIPSEAVRIIPE